MAHATKPGSRRIGRGVDSGSCVHDGWVSPDLGESIFGRDLEDGVSLGCRPLAGAPPGIRHRPP